jgi:hypothetical protein
MITKHSSDDEPATEPNAKDDDAATICSRQQDEQQKKSRRMEQQRIEVEQDPYDPLVPNDLLEYWEAQKVKREWEQHEQLRQELEQERQHRQELQQQLPSGRGRGGRSNLPAWLVEQQKREQQAALTLSSQDERPGAGRSTNVVDGSS